MILLTLLVLFSSSSRNVCNGEVVAVDNDGERMTSSNDKGEISGLNQDSNSASTAANGSNGTETDENNERDPSYSELEDLTDEELEEICTSRGFELIKTGERDGNDDSLSSESSTAMTSSFSHKDYVDAARQCLEIEAEMEEILKQNPTIANDIEEESKRISMENQRLQEERFRLEQQLAEAHKRAADKNNGKKIDMNNHANKTTAFVTDQSTSSSTNDALPRSDSDSNDTNVDSIHDYQNESTKNNEIDSMDSFIDDNDENSIIDLDIASNKNQMGTVDGESHTGKGRNDANIITTGDHPTGKDFGQLSQGEFNRGNENKLTQNPDSKSSSPSSITMADIHKEVFAKMREDAMGALDIILPPKVRGPMMKQIKTHIEALTPMAIAIRNMAIKSYHASKPAFNIFLESFAHTLDMAQRYFEVIIGTSSSNATSNDANNDIDTASPHDIHTPSL